MRAAVGVEQMRVKFVKIDRRQRQHGQPAHALNLLFNSILFTYGPFNTTTRILDPLDYLLSYFAIHFDSFSLFA